MIDIAYLEPHGYLICSEGTLDLQDMVYNFFSVISNIVDGKDAERASEISLEFQELRDSGEFEMEHSEKVSIFTEKLFEFMDSLAPEGAYFGTSEGDGALFGYWMTIESEENF